MADGARECEKSAVVIGVVVNPNSRKNRKQPPGRVEKIRRIVGETGEVRETESVGAVAPAVRDLIARKVDYLVSDGGDGAMNWMLNAAHDLAEEGALGPHLAWALGRGILERLDGRVRLTTTGRLLSNELFARLV